MGNIALIILLLPVSAHKQGIGVNTTRTYQYDTLGNLIRQEQDGCIEYKYNGAHLDESTKCGTIPNSIGTSYWEYTYDNRGNLVSRDKYTRTTSGMAWQNEAAYTYDETNRLVQGKNEDGEVSRYTYNGLGMRVGRELIMKDNTHGYTDFHSETPSVETGIDKPEVVLESYVIDYTSATFNPLTMDEDGGFSYRYVYGLNTLSVKITSEGTNWWGQHVTTDILKDYYHQDRLGSTTNLTDKFGRVVGRADYNEWGEITYREALTITSSYRRIYPQSSYTGHDWDDVLGMYYAKARFYSAEDKRFVAMDPIKGKIVNPLSLVPYVYCVDNPLRYVDPLGAYYIYESSDGKYIAKPESFMEATLESMGEQVPWAGPAVKGGLKALYSLNAVGGNSLDFSLGKVMLDEGSTLAQEVASIQVDKWIEKFLGDTVKTGISTIAKSISAIQFIDTFYDERKIPMIDETVFQLLDRNGIEAAGDSIEDVDKLMQRAYAFVLTFDWIFLLPAYTNYSNFMGTLKPMDGPRLFDAIRSLNDIYK